MRKFLFPLSILLTISFVGCGESDGALFDQNVTGTTSPCESNISIRNSVDLLKNYNLTYQSEKFYFSFDGIDDYDTTPSINDSGTYDSNINSEEDDNIKNFSITLKEGDDKGDVKLNGEMNGTIDFYCVDIDGDGVKESTWIRYIESFTNKLLTAEKR